MMLIFLHRKVQADNNLNGAKCFGLFIRLLLLLLLLLLCFQNYRYRVSIHLLSAATIPHSLSYLDSCLCLLSLDTTPHLSKDFPKNGR